MRNFVPILLVLLICASSLEVPLVSTRSPPRNEDIASTKSNEATQPDTATGSSGVSPYIRHNRAEVFSVDFWVLVSLSLICVLFAGFASGMTIGMLSIDPIQLRVSQDEGTDGERKRATELHDLVRQHHLLLVTLLLANSIAMEALPLFLDRIVPSWLAVILAVTAILLFAEVIPQALCTGKKQLAIASAGAPFVRILIVGLYVIAAPIAKLLDHILGVEQQGSYYARTHLKALIRMHQEPSGAARSFGGSDTEADRSREGSFLGRDEVIVIEGALDLARKTLKEIMVPLERLFMLEWETPLTPELFTLVREKGHSRIPVYKGSRHNIKGLLLAKSLIGISPNQDVKVGDISSKGRSAIFAPPDASLYEILNEFQKGQSHIAFIAQPPGGITASPGAGILGAATMEDVIEELIQEEILDEFDHKPIIRTPSPPDPGDFRSNRHKIMSQPDFTETTTTGSSGWAASNCHKVRRVSGGMGQDRKVWRTLSCGTIATAAGGSITQPLLASHEDVESGVSKMPFLAAPPSTFAPPIKKTGSRGAGFRSLDFPQPPHTSK